MDALSNPVVVLQQRAGDYALSIPEAAAVARVSARTMWRLVSQSKVKSVKASERRRIIMASELARHLTEVVLFRKPAQFWPGAQMQEGAERVRAC